MHTKLNWKFHVQLLSFLLSHQDHRGAVALSKHWCAELSTELTQLHIPLCSPHQAQLRKCCTLRKEVAAASRAKIFLVFTAQKSFSHKNRLRHPGSVWLKQQQQAAVKYPPREKPRGQGRKFLTQGHPEPVFRPRGIILFPQQTKNAQKG